MHSRFLKKVLQMSYMNKYFYCLKCSIIAFVCLVVFSTAGVVYAQRASQDSYRIAVDRQGNMRLLGMDVNSKYSDSLRKGEMLIDVASNNSVSETTDSINELKFEINNLNNQIKIQQAEFEIMRNALDDQTGITTKLAQVVTRQASDIIGLFERVVALEGETIVPFEITEILQDQQEILDNLYGSVATLQEMIEQQAETISILQDRILLIEAGGEVMPSIPEQTVNLHFNGTGNSFVDYGAIYNNASKWWISLWFKLDHVHENGTKAAIIAQKRIDLWNYLQIYLEGNGALYFTVWNANTRTCYISSYSIKKTWEPDVWFHVIAEISDSENERFLLNGMLLGENNWAAFVPDGADFVIGNTSTHSDYGFIGSIANVIIGTDDLTPVEEVALFNGTPPGDETEFWKMNEGSGTQINSIGSVGTIGVAGPGTTWVFSP